MKKYLWMIVVVVVMIILGVLVAVFNPNQYLEEIGYSEVTSKIKEKDTFILYIKSTDCEHCKKFTPTFTEVLSKYKVKAYTLNIAKLSEDEEDQYDDDFSDVDGTPTVLFYKKGERQYLTIEGEQTKVKIISKLKTAGFIK